MNKKIIITILVILISLFLMYMFTSNKTNLFNQDDVRQINSNDLEKKEPSVSGDIIAGDFIMESGNGEPVSNVNIGYCDKVGNDLHYKVTLYTDNDIPMKKNFYVDKEFLMKKCFNSQKIDMTNFSDEDLINLYIKCSEVEESKKNCNL